MRAILSNLLIPFGIHRDTHALIDPEYALSGRLCNCICPGCGSPLIGVHSTTKRKHFAHDSRNELYNPLKECDLSPQVALAMMIRHKAIESVGEAFDLPSLVINYDGYFACGCPAYIHREVTPERTITIDQIERFTINEGHTYDLRLQVDGKFIYIVLQYDTKDDKEDIDLTPYYESKSGLLAIDCEQLVHVISDMYESGDSYGDGVKLLFLKNVAKHWICHPRAKAIVDGYIASHSCGFGSALTKSNHTGTSVTASCAMCSGIWKHKPGDSLNCPSCNTHLYVTYS